ncbi:MAG: SPOR domain-containing protein [Pseudomonadota bacterium]
MPGILAFTAFVVLPLAALSISLGLKEFLDTQVAALEATAAEIAIASAEQQAAMMLAISTVPPGPILTLPELVLEVPVAADSVAESETLEELAETARQERAVAALAPLLDRSLSHPAIQRPPAGAPGTAGDAVYSTPMPHPARPKATPNIGNIASDLQIDTMERAQDGGATTAWGPTALAAPGVTISPVAPPQVEPPAFDPEINPAIPERTVSRSPYRIQLGAFPTHSEGVAVREVIAKRFGDLFDEQRLILQERRVGRRVYWRLLAGPYYDEAEADGICRTILDRAGDCFVWVRPSG